MQQISMVCAPVILSISLPYSSDNRLQNSLTYQQSFLHIIGYPIVSIPKSNITAKLQWDHERDFIHNVRYKDCDIQPMSCHIFETKKLPSIEVRLTALA